MRNIVLQTVGILCLLVLMFASSCKQTEPEQKNSILASDLAFKAEMANPDPDLNHLRDLYQLAEGERTQRSADPMYLMCCCPCPPTGIEAEQPDAETTSKHQCPCPKLFDLKIITAEDVIDTLRIDDQDFSKERDADGKIIYEFKGQLPKGECTLLMAADFLGTGVRTYRLELVVKNDKLYLRE